MIGKFREDRGVKMYRILIVDDEKIERNGIKMLLKMAGIELEIFEACNGKEALSFLQENQVDILLTDMKMPYVDGMDLLKEVCPENPQMKSIIFSGYSEFEYAKTAMKMGVKDYILKPVDPEEFKKTMEKVLKELDQQTISVTKETETDSFMKEHILYSLVNGMEADTVRSKTQEYFNESEINIYTRMMLIEANDPLFSNVSEEINDILSSNIKWNYKYLNLNEQQSVLLLEDTEQADYEKVGEKIVEEITSLFGKRCYIAVSHRMDCALKEIGTTFNKLEDLMEIKFYYSKSKVFLEEEREEGNVFARIGEDVLMKQMKQDIKMKDISSLREHFAAMCDKYRQNTSFSQVYIKFIFSNLLQDFYENLSDETGQNLNEEIEQLYCSSDFEQVLTIVNRNIDRLEKQFGCNPQMNHREIETVKKYIYENYDKEISVDYLADMVFMAPSYLSHVFKKETGQNLSKFIKAYRMEKAKEMLKETHNKIVNISYAVGYPNVSYFCQSFREYFGVSPQKFRDQG